MKHFSYLKQFIKDSLNQKTYGEVEVEGETFKEIIIDTDINYDDIMESTEKITLSRDNLIIDGKGHTVNLNHNSNVFSISSENVIIKNFIFKNGHGFSEGLIHNKGIVKIIDCSFLDCKASFGGAIYNEGVLIVENCTFKNNCASYHLGKGGAIYNENISLIYNSKFINNHSEYEGGAIFNEKTLLIDDCFFKKNTSKGYGGTIKNRGFYSVTGAINIFSKELDEIKGKACTIKNSVFDDSEGTVIRSRASLDIEKCVFKNSNSIISIGSFMANITDCLFENNYSYLIENTDSTTTDSDIILENCDFINNRHPNGLIDYNYALFKITNDPKHWTVKNCHFKNNASNYIFLCNSCDISFKNVSFKDNEFKTLLKYKNSAYYNENGILKLKNVSFNEKLENIILCEGNLEIDNCKFQKHQKINEESVLDIYESEKEFMNKLD